MIRPFPKPYLFQRPKLERLPMGGRVTVAAGILCSDGMILCADTEETITDDRKYDASKIRVMQSASLENSKLTTMTQIANRPRNAFRLEDAGYDWAAGITGAGHSDWVLAFVQGLDDEVFRNIKPEPGVLSKVKTNLDRYTQEFFSKYIRSYAEDPIHRPQAQMLVLIQFPKMYLLREIYRINDNLVLGLEANTSAAVGKGGPMFQHLADSLIKSSYSMKQTSSLAIYVMDKVKSDIPGCGGNSQIVMIGENGNIESIPTRRVRELEIHYADIEMRLQDGLAAEIVKELP